MALSSSEGRKQLEQRVLLAYLLQLNRYALQKGLITIEIYKEIEKNMRLEYGFAS